MEQILQITSTKANQGLVLGGKKKGVCVSMHPFCLKRNPQITKKIYTTSHKNRPTTTIVRQSYIFRSN